MKKTLIIYFLFASILFFCPQKIEAKTSENPFVQGILSTFSAREVLKPMVNTYDKVGVVSSSNRAEEKAGSGAILEIEKLGIRQEIKDGEELNGELLVEPGMVLSGIINDARVVYAHNGKDKFGRIYQLTHGDRLSITDEYEKVEYRLVKKEVVAIDKIASLLAKKNTLYLITCSYSEPGKRHLLQFIRK